MIMFDVHILNIILEVNLIYIYTYISALFGWLDSILTRLQ